MYTYVYIQTHTHIPCLFIHESHVFLDLKAFIPGVSSCEVSVSLCMHAHLELSSCFISCSQS